MRIAVYSGSFDPLHKGHKAVMEYLANEGGFDGVYLVVSPQSPFKEKFRALTGERRFKAAEEAVRKYPELHKVRVEDIELSMPSPNYTIDTLDALKRREPQNSFTLAIGADNLESIRLWKDYARILMEYGIAVYPRSGFDAERMKEELLEENALYRINMINARLADISSTEIREKEAAGVDMSEYLM